MAQDQRTLQLKYGDIASILQLIGVVMGIAVLCGPIYGIVRKHSVLVGVILDLDAGAKTVAIKTADGAKHTFLFVEHTAVHGTREVGSGTEYALHELEKGSKVVVHYTAVAGRDAADEIDKVGDDGLKVVKVTVKHVDRAAKTVAVETADGAKETYRLTTDAAAEMGKGAEKTARGTAYITEEVGHKVVHFFERAI